MKYLKQHVWTEPEHYAGFSPDGDYVVMTRHRDSDLLSESNWDEATELLGATAFDSRESDYASRPAVYTWSAGHWAVGWVEYMMVRADAAADILARAEKMLSDLDGYPVLNESDWSEREFNAVSDYWAQMSVRERADYLRDADLSIFAARRDYLPREDDGRLYERLREGF